MLASNPEDLGGYPILRQLHVGVYTTAHLGTVWMIGPQSVSTLARG